jgi:uncharacterized membrane protein YqiK
VHLNESHASEKLVETINIEAEVIQKEGKMDAEGLEPQAESSQPLSVVNPKDGDRTIMPFCSR